MFSGTSRPKNSIFKIYQKTSGNYEPVKSPFNSNGVFKIQRATWNIFMFRQEKNASLKD